MWVDGIRNLVFHAVDSNTYICSTVLEIGNLARFQTTRATGSTRYKYTDMIFVRLFSTELHF